MNLHSLLTKIVQSQPTDWHTIRGCNGYDVYAVLKSDIAIAMAWGRGPSREFHEEWATCFANPTTTLTHVDIFCNRALVHRDSCVIVDGGRCFLPIPHSPDDLRVAPAYAKLIHLIGMLDTGVGEYPCYFRRAGLKPADLPWPTP